ncbi:hypothetical protein CASFOL_006022 [Castilleja foliolosa]|uniref:Uncharacterized protein n=1 Tax=Castilleja foliolosa TaxID=1961234 RepID=A0ABD3E643_9LAMI
MEDEEMKKDEYESYVIVHNIAKRHNVGTLARSATAFGTLARSATASVLTVAVELFGYLWFLFNEFAPMLAESEGNFGLQGLRE